MSRSKLISSFISVQ